MDGTCLVLAVGTACTAHLLRRLMLAMLPAVMPKVANQAAGSPAVACFAGTKQPADVAFIMVHPAIIMTPQPASCFLCLPCACRCLLALHALCVADVGVVAEAFGADPAHLVRGLMPSLKVNS